MVWISGDMLGSSGWPKVDGVWCIASIDRCSDVGVSYLSAWTGGAKTTCSVTVSGPAEICAVPGGAGSTSGECNRESGGESGSSGRSSRNLDMVRLGTPELTRRGTKVIGGAGTCCEVGMESLDVLEKEGDPLGRRLFLLPHRNRDAQESGAREELASVPLCDCSDCSVLISDV